MAQATAAIIDKPAWVDLSSSDAQASRDFYAKVFGWKVEVNPDPQYGGYALAKIGDKDAAGIGPAQDPSTPTAWNVYIGTDDVEALREGCSGRRDRDRAAVRRRRPGQDGGLPGPGRRVHLGLAGDEDGRLPDRRPEFLRLGRAQRPRHREGASRSTSASSAGRRRTSEMGEGQPPYTEFLLDGESVAGAWEMNPMVPAEVPSYWQVYFAVDDVDGAFRKAIDAGAPRSCCRRRTSRADGSRS